MTIGAHSAVHTSWEHIVWTQVREGLLTKLGGCTCRAWIGGKAGAGSNLGQGMLIVVPEDFDPESSGGSAGDGGMWPVVGYMTAGRADTLLAISWKLSVWVLTSSVGIPNAKSELIARGGPLYVMGQSTMAWKCGAGARWGTERTWPSFAFGSGSWSWTPGCNASLSSSSSCNIRKHFDTTSSANWGSVLGLWNFKNFLTVANSRLLLTQQVETELGHKQPRNLLELKWISVEELFAPCRKRIVSLNTLETTEAAVQFFISAEFKFKPHFLESSFVRCKLGFVCFILPPGVYYQKKVLPWQ